MTFADNVLSLLTAAFAVLVPIFVGHALVAHAAWPVIVATAAGLISVGLGALTIRRIRPRS